jgi:uncharacterized repeat protein (TIGR03806 family)
MTFRKFTIAAGVAAVGVAGALSVSVFTQPEPVAAAMGPVMIDVSAKPARNISEYNLFKDPARQIPNDGVVPYDLNSPLFSDYAAKHRFVYVPEGQQARYDDKEVFDFPVGSVIVKTFAFLNDMNDPAKGERIIETRLLVHKPDGWVGLPYVWNEDVTEARLAVAGGRAEVSWIHTDGSEREVNYIVPNMNQCKQCHENAGALQPIGPKARHLNKDYAYESGAENQLVHWSKTGILDGLPEDVETAPRCAVWDDPASGTLDERARAYLDINCAHCHNPDGPAHTSGLDLTFYEDDPFRWGVYKAPVAAGRGSGGHLYGILPGKPEQSILLHRMESVDPGVMMPQLPRTLVHEEGNALIRDWIADMKPEDFPLPEQGS